MPTLKSSGHRTLIAASFLLIIFGFSTGCGSSGDLDGLDVIPDPTADVIQSADSTQATDTPQSDRGPDQWDPGTPDPDAVTDPDHSGNVDPGGGLEDTAQTPDQGDEPDGTVEIEHLLRIWGGVFDTESELPILGQVAISINGQSFESSGGSFDVTTHVPAGTVSFSLESLGFEPYPTTFDIAGPDTINKDVFLVPLAPDKGILHVKLIDANTKNPVEGPFVYVSISKEAVPTVSYANHTFSNITPGTVQINALAQGYVTQRVSGVEVVAGYQELEIELSPTTFLPGRTSIRVFDGLTGENISSREGVSARHGRIATLRFPDRLEFLNEEPLDDATISTQFGEERFVFNYETGLGHIQHFDVYLGKGNYTGSLQPVFGRRDMSAVGGTVTITATGQTTPIIGGEFSFEDINCGQWPIEIAADGYHPITTYMLVQGGRTETYTYYLVNSEYYDSYIPQSQGIKETLIPELPSYPNFASNGFIDGPSKPFYIATTELRFEIWFQMKSMAARDYHQEGYKGAEVMAGLPQIYFMRSSQTCHGGFGNMPPGEENMDDNHPVVDITLRDAKIFANLLTEYHNYLYGTKLTPVYRLEIKPEQVARGCFWNPSTLPEGCEDIIALDDADGYRLPTPQEMAIAARYLGRVKPTEGKLADDALESLGHWWAPHDYAAGAADNVYNETATKAVAWYYGNTGGKTQLMGKKRATFTGLYDVSGNASEYTYDPQTDRGHRVGGSARSTADDLVIDTSYRTLERDTMPETTVRYVRNFRPPDWDR